ncbi:hypothetical protein FRB98_002713 [Tulasnella sp. 332]|nr:hypothetical protein FRB98_002713 [Tulasnella sp. 332]
MQYWLMKAEPDSRVVKGKEVKFSVDDFEKVGITPWEGVRNHAAKLNMKSMKAGDQVLFYHSNCKIPGIAAIAEVHKESYPDYTAWESTHPYFDAKSDASKPTWFMVDLKFRSRLPNFVSLALLRYLETRTHADLAFMATTTSMAPKALGEDAGSLQGMFYLTEVELEAIKSMPLLTQGRLSVQRVEENAFNAVRILGQRGGWESISFTKPKKIRKDGSASRARPPRAKQSTRKRDSSLENRGDSEESGCNASKKRMKTEIEKASDVGPRRSSRRNAQ